MTGPGPLSGWQRQVAELVAGGLTNKEIAGRLGVSAHTADTHLKRSYAKTGANSRTRLTTWLADRR